MADTQAEPKLLLPQLKPFYDFVIPLAWPVIRIACGWNLAVHGWGKVTRGPGAYVKAFADSGFDSHRSGSGARWRSNSSAASR